MTRSLYAVPAMLCLAAAVVTAQAPAADRPANPPAGQEPATQQQKPAAPPAASASAKPTVSYSGCLKPGTAAGTWVLENAEAALKPGAAPSTVGTSGTSKLTLNLDPAATVNLTPHANHKIEVSGTLSPGKPAVASEAASPASAGAQAPRQQFSVESMKMVSATCP